MIKWIQSVCFIYIGLNIAAQAATVLALTPKQLQQMQVTWAQLQPQRDRLSASYPAEVMMPPAQTRVVTAAQSGLITQLKVSVGDTVKQGQVIGQLSSPDLINLQSRFLQAETQARLHAQALERDLALFKDGIIAQRRLQETQSAYDTSTALLNEQRQTLSLAGMPAAHIQQLARNRVLQSGMALTAPISGQVMMQHQQVGARVDIATPILTISHSKPLWLMIQVPVEVARTLTPGMIVRLPAQQLQAKIETILKQLNPQNQSIQVRASIYQGSEQLALGQIIDVTFLSASETVQGQRFSLPRAAVARQGPQAVVFMRTPRGVAVVPVNVLGEQQGQLTIEGALDRNSWIAMQGVAALKGHWHGLGAHAGKE